MDVGILVFDGADELDVVGPHRVFAAANEVRELTGSEEVATHLISEGIGSVQLGGGLVVVPTDTFFTSPDLDVLVVPGGSSDRAEGRRAAQQSPPTLEFINATASKAKVLASVCTGAFLLASAGRLADKKANTHWRYRDELVEFMQERGESFDLVVDRVVWDGTLVTGGGVTSGIDIALSIVEKMLGENVRSGVERALETTTPSSQSFSV